MESHEQKTAANAAARHEAGALPAWGLIGGAGVGALVGLIFHKVLIGALVAGSVCWTVGAVLERNRR